jgi:outer membrane protein
MRTVASGATAMAGVMAGVLVTGLASAQRLAATPQAAPPPAQTPAPAPTPAPALAAPPAPPGAASQAAISATSDTPLPVPTELLQAHPGGITGVQVGARAAATSYSAKASEETLRGAAARVDEAWAAFLPRLSLLGKYTRLSNFTPPTIFNIQGDLVVTGATAGPEPFTGGGEAVPVNFSFPFFVVDNWLFQAGITVPITDYLLRIDQGYTSATHSEEAARWDLITARASSLSSGEVAYYTWLRSRGGVIVAVQAVNDQKTHLRDARNQFAVGNASKADVLRAETAVASAELALERAKNLADLSEKQMRVAMHAKPEEVFQPGEDLEAPLAPVQGNVEALTNEALVDRPEVRSADANAAAAKDLAAQAKAGRYPNLSAFADGILGNPNPRYIPPSNVFNATWDVGAQVTWSPNDVLTANGSVTDLESRAAAIEANKQTVRDSIEVDVTQSLQAVREADFSIETSTREQASAEEAYRVARELFNNGRGTSTTLTDAETDVTRARLDLLNAKVDARVARIRLDHALGRDAKPGQ